MGREGEIIDPVRGSEFKWKGDTLIRINRVSEGENDAHSSEATTEAHAAQRDYPASSMRRHIPSV